MTDTPAEGGSKAGSLRRFDVVYTAAGTPNSMVRFDREVLFALVAGQVAQISRDQ